MTDDKEVEEVEVKVQEVIVTGNGTQKKITDLIHSAEDIKAALNRRTFWLIMGMIIPLVLGTIFSAILLWNINDSAMRGEMYAKDAYIQSLNNERRSLYYEKNFAETRDCPVEYFRELLNVSRERGDLATVEPPCEPADIGDLDAQIAVAEEKIRKVEGR